MAGGESELPVSSKQNTALSTSTGFAVRYPKGSWQLPISEMADDTDALNVLEQEAKEFDKARATQLPEIIAPVSADAYTTGCRDRSDSKGISIGRVSF